MYRKLFLFLVVIVSQSIFGELVTLDDLINSALNNNPTVISKDYEVKAAKARKYSAFTNFLPSATGSYRYTYLGEIPYMTMDLPEDLAPLLGEDGGKIKMGEEDNYVLTLSATQPIFTGFSIINGYQLSNLDLENTIIQKKKNKSELVFDVKSAYYNLVRIINTQRALDIAISNINAHLTDINNLYTNGMVGESEVLQVQIALEEIELSIIQTNDAKRILRQNLEILTNSKINIESLDTSITITKPELVQENPLKKNFDLLQLKLANKMKKKQVALARGKLMPQVALAYNYTYQNPGQTGETGWHDTWDVSLVVQMDLWGFGRNIANYENEKYQYKAFLYEKKYNEKRLNLAFDNLMNSVEEHVKMIDLSSNKLTLAIKNLDIQKEKFKHGQATSTDVLDAESTFIKAKTDNINSIIDYNIKSAELSTFLGRIK